MQDDKIGQIIRGILYSAITLIDESEDVDGEINPSNIQQVKGMLLAAVDVVSYTLPFKQNKS